MINSMSYIKCGIVTKIEMFNCNKSTLDFLTSSFNLRLFSYKDNTYFLKESFLKENLFLFREEFLKFSNKYGDSINDSVAYCLNTYGDKLINNEIFLCNNNEKFYFANYNSFKFDTDVINFTIDKTSIKIFFIPIFWDINKIEAEDFSFVSMLVDKFIRSAMNNVLKDASIFTIV